MPGNYVITGKPTVPVILVELKKKNFDALGDAAIETNTQLSSPSYDLRKFCLTRILNNNTKQKCCALLGTFPDLSPTDMAIVLLEKQAFRESDVQTNTSNGNATKRGSDAAKPSSDDEEALKPSYFSTELKVNTDFINNIYGSFQCVPGAQALNEVKTMVVYPATTKHIAKYSVCQKYIIRETEALYEKLTLPYIESSQFDLDWVYNILEHKSEVERIVYEDSDQEMGFILVPDLKWDGKNVETLYLLALTHKRNIKSLRDLRASHLPLLRNIRESAAAVIERRYGLSAAQLRMYFHYQPSFYHLHVHINLVRNDAPGIWCEKSHMLDTVINNLQLLPEYYQRATLPFVLYENNKLLELYEQEFPLLKAVTRSVAEDTDDTQPARKKAKSEGDPTRRVDSVDESQTQLTH